MNTGSVLTAVEALTASCQDRGWSTRTIQGSVTFVRLLVESEHGPLLIDLAVDVAPSRPPIRTAVGPAFDPEELAGRKLIALFDRAEARDFADVYLLSQRFGRQALLDRAAEVDLGFDTAVLAQMMRGLGRFDDDEIPIDPGLVESVRRDFAEWADALDGRNP